MRRRIIIHSRGHAAAALEAAASLQRPVTLASAPGAGAYGGPRWFLALVAEASRAHPGAVFDAVVDCADEPGTVLAALRAGAARVRFGGGGEARQKLAAVAAELGAELEGESEVPALDLLGEADPRAACRVYLAR